MIYEGSNPQPQQQAEIAQRAVRLYPDTELVPDNSRNRQEWARAVSVVRQTSGGWVLDQFIGRRQ